MTPSQLRQIAGQSRRRALHCPQCGYPLQTADGDVVINGRYRQTCAGHTRGKYVASHAKTLLLLAEVAQQLAELLEQS